MKKTDTKLLYETFTDILTDIKNSRDADNKNNLCKCYIKIFEKYLEILESEQK